MRVPERARALAGPLLVATTAVALALRTRRMWGDPVVDFGREVYVAWRVSEGADLYRDVAHFNGPLASYANAAWFDVMGCSSCSGCRWDGKPPPPSSRVQPALSWQASSE